MDQSKYTHDWILNSSLENFVEGATADQFLKNPKLFEVITETIQDGVTVLDDKHVVHYVNRTMEHWYDWDVRASVGNKCYMAFHDRSTPCDNCPVSKCFETSAPQAGIVHYDSGGERLGLQMLYSIPIYDEDRSVKFVIEYVKDITIQEQYDQLISQLQSQVEHLEKQNAVLAQAFVERETLHHKSEEHLVKSMQQLLEPSVKRCGATPSLTLLKGIPMISDAPVRESSDDELSRRESQICRMILDDMTSKEIADNLFVTHKTVDFHRSNIRRKLKLDKGRSLVSYLRSQFGQSGP